MRIPRALLVLLAAAAVPAAAHAQRDTIRLGGGAEPRDTIHLAAPEDTAPAEPARPGRWSQPFAVEGSGEVASRPPAREAVWLPADSVRARRIAARRDAADTTQLAATDSATDEAEPVDSAPPPARRSTRTASRDTASAPRRTTRTTRSDTTATARRTSSTDDEGSDAPRPTRRTTAGRDTATLTRRTASRDTATSTRRTTSRDTATATRRTTSRDTATTRRTTSRDTAATRRTTATTASRARMHTVASGETLFGLARRYGVTTAQIRALNPDLGETLETGTVLRLPAGARTPAQREGDDDDRPAPRRAAAADSDSDRSTTRRPSTTSGDTDRPAARTAAGRTRRHTVAAGETLYGIARRYGVTVDAIRRANRLEGDTVRPGQALVIPAAPAPQR